MKMILVAALMWLWAAAPSPAQTVTATSAPPPDEIAASVKARLAPAGAAVKVGDKTLEFWWVTAVPLTAGEASWAHVDEGTLVGAVRISAAYTDIRGRGIKAGVYLLRYALQPQNGDHLGASPYREFLLLSPAALDAAPGVLSHDAAVEQAKKAGASSHPAAWSLDPPAATGPALQVHTTDEGHTSVIVEVPATKDGQPAGALKFGLILVGRIEA